jgi:hyperosmotically inducible protein
MKRLILATLMLGFASATFAADRTNSEVFRDVSTQVNRYAYFTIFDSVSAGVHDGVVTLSGKVTMPYKASDIEKRVAKIDGVTDVENKIEVLPVSTFDDQLRRRIARALYSNPSLAMYGLGPNPSIHVIVERGHVTLDGVVNSDMDRTIANSIARSSMAFSVKNELKTDEEMKQQLEKL